MKIFCINGMPMSGKSTFAELCCKEVGGFGLNISTVDFVKKIAKEAGWNGEKTPENRKFLSDLKDLLTKWDDVPYKKVCEVIRLKGDELQSYGFETLNMIVFIHVREPQEIQKFVDRLGAKTILVRRPEVEQLEQSNHADAEVFNYTYDYVIYNDGTLKDLEDKAKNFICINKV